MTTVIDGVYIGTKPTIFRSGQINNSLDTKTPLKWR